MIEFVSLFFASFGLGLSITEYEMKDFTNTSMLKNIVVSYSQLCNFCLILCIYFRYLITLQWNKSRGNLTKLDNLMNTGLF